MMAMLRGNLINEQPHYGNHICMCGFRNDKHNLVLTTIEVATFQQLTRINLVSLVLFYNNITTHCKYLYNVSVINIYLYTDMGH